MVSASGLITITGGKWTTYRKMAEDTVDLAIQSGGVKETDLQNKNPEFTWVSRSCRLDGSVFCIWQ